ncbi:hypothetical protein ACSYAD_24180 [Acaryochloris marina NIES-2412]|uniref:hypothetical protein n=1 Tax=Acaryochloris marina TaxID=155978 RepID=UPI0040580963
MQKTLEIQELALVLAVKRQDPTLLNPEFLHYSGIIPEAWELAQQPVRQPQGSQVSFQNGVNIVAHPNQTVFVESLRDKAEDEIQIAGVAQRFSEILRNIEYQAVGVNFRGHVTFTGGAESAHDYLFNTLLAPGPWQQQGTAPVRAGLNLMYTFEDNRLNLGVQEAALQLPEGEQVPILMFTGNFETDLREVAAADRLGQVQQLVGNWPSNLGNYRTVVEQFLTAQADSLDSSTVSLDAIPTAEPAEELPAIV